MARFRPSGKPVKPVVPAKSRRQTSRLCLKEWGSGCTSHGGKECRCTGVWRHGGSCECDCGGTS
ncbi:hypothetical protein [Nonomuraea sp. KM90]|uniref:hypothetical protein n=1 Tax=Nonomuraea sp. KM90 TaxID=3457428 RepID=UPI003FCD60A0